MSGIQSYVQGSKRQKEHVFAELKCGALFIYETNQLNEDCKIIIPIHNYNVSIYPENHQDHDIFGGDASSPYLTSNNELFISCARPVDKEDWYFGLLAATNMMSESPSHVEMMDITHFDLAAMQTLISTVQQDAEYREVQWLNAILGRLFLGMYKTEEMRDYFQEKISKKTQKIKRPSFLGEISVQSVDIGNSIPFVTQPKLLSLTPEGDLTAEATVHYAGGLQVVIQTDFNWNYSSLMKPIRVPLVLSVTLKKLSGKLLLKVKPPPTNRYWVAFYEMPVMDWEITPIVSDKQIRLSMVTNAIQSKIREFMLENVVLPNMDDFAFCPSGGKGGIFGERVPKPS
ncbi:putative integral membrane protein conserved region-domain-containing protein, partial [Thamnidium elegans]